MIEHYKKIVRDCEKAAAVFMKNQILDKTSHNYGGVLAEDELVQPKSTIYCLTTAISLYYTKDSGYFQKPELYERIVLALNYVKSQQREDGTFDYINCNFYAAPDTAFCIRILLPSYRLLLNYSDDKSLYFKNDIYEIMKKAAYGIVKGGFHTPNHRWAIASVLMACFNITGEEQFKSTALEYLAEGIDSNEYGEYAERSAGGYNGVNNDAMILLYEETGEEGYLEYVNKNLKMMFTYFEPDGSIFTNNSTRQDRGRKVYPIGYYFQYLYMAHKTNNQDFAAAANKIMEDANDLGLRSPNILSDLMLYPELIQYETSESKYPDSYKKYYKESGIVRARRKDISYSILENNGRFLYFQAGALAMYMRIGATYFDQREFKVQKLKGTETGYILNYSAQGWYYKPFKEKPETSDWWQMDHSKREKIYGPDLNIVVTLEEINEGINVNIKTEGCDRVPLKIEMCFNEGGIVKSEGFICEATAGRAITALSGNLKVTKGMDTIEVGPAFGKHNLVAGYAGGEASSRNHFTIFFTDVTNFDRTITLKKG
jgi:hypothetical protein